MTKKIATQKEYTETFKMQAVGLVRSTGRSAASVAKQLNIPVWKLRNWIKDAEEQSEKTAEQDELIRLRNENKQLKEDMEFLKKAAAYFAKNQQ
ncbi:MAG: transposase [Candidatus Obscuribacterales bacterium]|jgi:transposase|nr:transposase [Candidatus Obscuribacterales bacterium]